MSRGFNRIIAKAYKQLPEFPEAVAQEIEGIIASNHVFFGKGK